MSEWDFSKVLVSLILFTLIAFTVAVLWIFAVTGSEPTTLIQYFYITLTGELGILGWIKAKKINKGV